MKRSISSTALLFTSVSAIIGSGWLFSSYYAATLAGPASLLSWLLGGAVSIIIAFVFGEICSLLPITGFSARVPQFTHGTVVGVVFSCIVWLSYVAFVPAEVQAIIQYISFYFPDVVTLNGGLTLHGYGIAAVLMMIVSFINAYSLKWLIDSNSLITILKIVIPIAISAVMLYFHFSWQGTIHPLNSVFMPYGAHGVFAALTSGGIVFAFNGFKQAAEMAGEAKCPKFALPFAILGSIVICLVIFLLLQAAFLVSLQPSNMSGGWAHLVLPGKSSPFAAIISQNGLSFMLPVLYLCAVLAPLAAGLMYCSSAARSLYGMSKNKYLPPIFQKLSPRGNPIYAVAANFVVGMFMFLHIHGWENMATFLSILVIVTYAVGPVALLALRQQLPGHLRIFNLPFARIWSLVAFYVCTLMIYWCGWKVVFKVSLAFLLIFIALILYDLKNRHNPDLKFNWKYSIWLWVYFIGLTIFSYCGSFGNGHNIIPFGWDFLVLGLFSMLVLWLALKFKLPAAETQAYVKELQSEM